MIVRDVAGAAQREFDLVVVGGGIYGVSLLQEAARRGLSACLCEAGDFGGGTSWNSLRIVHGGLRYLQTMDLRRFFQSVAARRRIARQFPSLVRPLQCLMPLYGQGMKRASVMRVALLANDVLSWQRNRGVDEPVRLQGGSVLDAAATRRAFPQVRPDGLEGAACWSDYLMVSSERILVELLHDACRHGALALNYVPVERILGSGGRVSGVTARDALSGQAFTIAARTVVNCAGPQVRALAPEPGVEAEPLFRPSLAFNLLLDLELPVSYALAVAAPEPAAPVLFLVPQGGVLLAGTLHVPRPMGTTAAAPTAAEIEAYLDMLNRAIPGLGAAPRHVRRVFAGLLPAAAEGSAELQKREILLDHARIGGLSGAYSVSGVKYTTANDVAVQVLDLIGSRPAASHPEAALPVSAATHVLSDERAFESCDDDALRAVLRSVAHEEAVHCSDDALLRRTGLHTASQQSFARLEATWHALELPGVRR